MKTKRINSLRWLLEPLEEGPGYLEKPMFGCLAAYLHGRLMAVLADSEAPWDGLLVPTSRESHASLVKDFPALSPHPVLGKWLYLSSSHEDFEEVASGIIEAVSSGDPRFGVEPKEKKPAKRKATSKSAKRK